MSEAKPWGYIPEPTVRASLFNGLRVFADDAIPLLVIGFIVIAIGVACGSMVLLYEYGQFYSMGVYLTIAGPLEFGLSFVCLRAVRSGRINVEHLLAVFGRYWPLVLANGILTLILPGAFAMLLIPGLIFYCLTRFVPYLLLEDELGGAEAIRESIRLSRGCFWQLAGICAIGMAVMLVAGFTLLGLVPALIWWNLSLASLYHSLVRPPSGWAVEDAEDTEMLETERDAPDDPSAMDVD